MTMTNEQNMMYDMFCRLNSFEEVYKSTKRDVAEQEFENPDVHSYIQTTDIGSFVTTFYCFDKAGKLVEVTSIACDS